MSQIPQMLLEKAAEMESWNKSSDLVKEALVQELIKQGMEEDVAHGVSDEMEPSYMDLWHRILTDPNGSYMNIPLDADQLRKVAEYIEDLEHKVEEVEKTASLGPKKELLDKLAGLGLSPEQLEQLETPTLEKIASLQNHQNSPKEMGTPLGISKAGAPDPFTQFLLS